MADQHARVPLDLDPYHGRPEQHPLDYREIALIHIDDHALSLHEFGQLLRTYAGWGMGATLYFFRAVTTNIRSISSRGASYSMRLLMPHTPRSPHL